MCKSSLHPFLQALPKCEHHLHIEGALSPALLFRLAATNNIELPKDDPAFQSVASLRARYERFVSLDDFLHYYYIGMSVLITAEDFAALAWDYFSEHAAVEGVAHAEVFFDPQAHLSRGVSYDTVVSGLKAARQRAQKELGISSELICCFLRHLPVPECIDTFHLESLQHSLKNGDVTGIGLDSSEANFPPALFKDIYQEAKTLGIRRTAHAGEEGPASFIQDAKDVLEVERIDHGIRLVDDPQLLKRLADDGTLLTVCPYSNLQLNCVRSMEELPIRTFLDAGVAFSINSDDPAYFGNHYILDNYCAVQIAFNLSIQDWRRIGKAGIRGSWCTDDRKAELLEKLEQVVKKFSNE